MKAIARGVVCAMALAWTFAACGTSPPQQSAAAQAARPERPAPLPAARRPALPVEIVSISPETILVRGGHALPRRYTVEYRIANPEKIETALLHVHARGLEDIASQPVPVTASGTAEILVPAKDFDFGPTVRFRATCPEGTTEWFTLGQEPLPLEMRTAPGLRIAAVGPEWIGYDLSEMDGTVVKIRIAGRELSSACKAEGDIDGRPLELLNPYFLDRGISGAIRRSDLGGRPVAARYLEVKLSIRGRGVGQVAIKHVPFAD